MNMQQKIVIILADCLILVEVFIAMYFAHQNAEQLTALFVKYFFSMLVPTLIFTKVAMRLLRTREVQVCS
jgi:hypothetical protein